MSTEVTPESLRTHAQWLRDKEGWSSQAYKMDAVADRLVDEQRALPTVPGWYPTIVVERGGESCTGALLRDDGRWVTPRLIGDAYTHHECRPADTIRWAEQDGKTPGETARDAAVNAKGAAAVSWANLHQWESIANAILAAHGTPTLTPVGEHPEPGTRGLLPVVVVDSEIWQSSSGWLVCDQYQGRKQDILADPRPDGAHA